ncbi:hypothetical protein HG536_0G04890 [Torulaspora globosa]|uniref:Cystathionine beta-lyase n=1 Tax=Torulaspora globosa TaxID=48254 RepID=A0A7G3ZM91_9SACH|nr:uncharacterized protein HG536_0G04890 [Torulaspora globosa]QLL34627.1 hypothetical protein HG536_0G04890 [Torulaspora globosa]
MTKSEETFPLGVDSLLCAVGRHTEEQFGFLNPPLYKGSTIIHKTVKSLENHEGRFFYGIAGSPTIANLEDAWTKLTEAAGTVISPSGHGSIALAILSVISAGCHILVPESVFPPTAVFCNTFLSRLAVEVEYYDPLIGVGIEKLIKDNTVAIYMESPGSNTMEVQDVPAIVQIAKRNGLKTIIDNTWATPLFFKPHSFGVDLSIEAGTKYVGGHSDILLGLVTANEENWPALKSTYSCLGMLPGAEDCHMALRSLRTFRLRVREAERKALKIAKWLQRRDEVERVLHPAFEECPGHEYWARDFRGSTGLFSIILRPRYSRASLEHMLENMVIFSLGYSWGGYESLIVPLSEEVSERLKARNHYGYGLRLQIGLEDIEDLQKDLVLGFERLKSVI